MTLARASSSPRFGSLLGATFGNGLTLAQSWGNDGRLASKRLYKTAGGTNLSSLTYAYDNDDDISAITDGVTAAKSVTYGYDTVGRLAQSVTSGGTTKRQDFDTEYIVDLFTSKQISSIMLEINNKIDWSVNLVKEREGEEAFFNYRLIAGRIMGLIATELLMPIYEEYPELVPPELK